MSAGRVAMHLAALSAGAQAPRGNGAVHSVFGHACNVRLDDGRMLALLAPHLGNVPHGVRLDVPAGFGFSRQVAVGQRVGCRADVLRVAGGELSIDLGTAHPWRGELPAGGADLASPEVARAWRTAWGVVQHDRARGNHADFTSLARAVDRQGVRLAYAARAMQADEAARAVDGLIGRGPGLTPAGDDLIVGLLAGLRSTTGNHPARCAFLEALCTAVAVAAAATGDISRAYLIHACHGEFAEPLTTLARGIAEGADRGVVEFAATAALRVGHTSGRDGAFGLLLGLAVWAPQPALSALARQVELSAGSSLVEPGCDNWKYRAIGCSANGSGQQDRMGLDRATRGLLLDGGHGCPTPVGRRTWDGAMPICADVNLRIVICSSDWPMRSWEWVPQSSGAAAAWIPRVAWTVER